VRQDNIASFKPYETRPDRLALAIREAFKSQQAKKPAR
jgi:hypothetical protein